MLCGLGLAPNLSEPSHPRIQGADPKLKRYPQQCLLGEKSQWQPASGLSFLCGCCTTLGYHLLWTFTTLCVRGWPQVIGGAPAVSAWEKAERQGSCSFLWLVHHQAPHTAQTHTMVPTPTSYPLRALPCANYGRAGPLHIGSEQTRGESSRKPHCHHDIATSFQMPEYQFPSLALVSGHGAVQQEVARDEEKDPMLPPGMPPTLQSPDLENGHGHGLLGLKNRGSWML